MITLMKNFSDENKTQKKINIKKIVSLKDAINKPIEALKIKLKKIDDIYKIKSLRKEEAKTDISIEVKDDKKKYIFKLKEKRKIDHNLINSLKKDDNIEII